MRISDSFDGRLGPRSDRCDSATIARATPQGTVSVRAALALGAALILANAPAARADAAGDARRFCSALKQTNLRTGECSVSAPESSVDISVEMSASEARGICDTVPAMLAELGIRFEKGWTLRIHPSDDTIAVCNLE